LDFINHINQIEEKGNWDKTQLIELIKYYCPTLSHIDTGKFLDGKM